MSNGDRIVVTFAIDGTEPIEELYETNHNVYRLNSNNEIIWQVQRDDSVYDEYGGAQKVWADRHRIAREDGADGYRIPFSYITLEYSDGKCIDTDPHGDGANILTWEEGCIIHLYGQGNDYILDPQTGIAKNVVKKGGREW